MPQIRTITPFLAAVPDIDDRFCAMSGSMRKATWSTSMIPELFA
jgi:hypothetical protein